MFFGVNWDLSYVIGDFGFFWGAFWGFWGFLAWFWVCSGGFWGASASGGFEVLACCFGFDLCWWV